MPISTESRIQLPAGVVRRLSRHLDVVRVTLLETSRRDADELGSLQATDVRRAHVAHRRAQSTEQLMSNRGNRAVIGHLPLDAFGNQLVVGQDVVLEVAVFRVGPRLTPRLHRTERTHAAVRLELLSVDEDQLAGRLVTSREKRAEHDGVSTGCDCLGDVTRIGNAAVGDDRNACLTRDRCNVVDSGELWYANTGYDARRTYRARSYATLHRVGTCGD